MKTQPQPISLKSDPCDAIILCGGLGTRLRSVVSDRPKVLASVGGRPFLDIVIEHLAAAGISRIILSVGYLREQVKERYANVPGIFFAEEEAPLGTGGGVKNAERLTASDHVLVMNGDSWIAGGLDIASLEGFHKSHDSLVTLVLARPRIDKDYGVVMIDEGGKIIRFHEKKDQCEGHFMSAGVYILDRRAFGMMPSAAFSLENDFFPTLVGGALYGYPINGVVHDIGTPERFEAAQYIFYS